MADSVFVSDAPINIHTKRNVHTLVVFCINIIRYSPYVYYWNSFYH